MKNSITILILSLFTSCLYSQSKMKINLNNGKIISGTYKFKRMSLGFPTETKIISTTEKKKYKLRDIKNLIVFMESDSVYMEVIDTKQNINSKETKKKLAKIGYDGEKIKLYYVSELIYQGGAIGNFTRINSYYESYVKRTSDNIAYNMGYIYGAGPRGIKKRVRDYFTDCSKLIEAVENNQIPKKETLRIAEYYDKNCSN